VPLAGCTAVAPSHPHRTHNCSRSGREKAGERERRQPRPRPGPLGGV